MRVAVRRPVPKTIDDYLQRYLRLSIYLRLRPRLSIVDSLCPVPKGYCTCTSTLKSHVTMEWKDIYYLSTLVKIRNNDDKILKAIAHPAFESAKDLTFRRLTGNIKWIAFYWSWVRDGVGSQAQRRGEDRNMNKRRRSSGRGRNKDRGGGERGNGRGREKQETRQKERGEIDKLRQKGG